MINKTAERIQEQRTLRSMKQVQVANLLGVTRNAVNSWEMASTYPSIKSLISLSHLFHVSTDYLLGIDDRKIIDVSKLTFEQNEIVAKLVDCLEDSNQK